MKFKKREIIFMIFINIISNFTYDLLMDFIIKK